MHIRYLAIIATVCFWPITASAGWQYTHWGMTQKQVEVASKGKAVEATAAESANYSARDGSEIVKLAAPYSTGSFKFTAYFGFIAGKLTSVALDLNDGNPNEVIGALRNKYGKPEHEDPDETMSAWMWNKGDDSIQAIMIGDTLMVNYVPRHSSNENGL